MSFEHTAFHAPISLADARAKRAIRQRRGPWVDQPTVQEAADAQEEAFMRAVGATEQVASRRLRVAVAFIYLACASAVVGLLIHFATR